MDLWSTVSNFARMTSIPEPTLRRYISKFSSYFRVRKEKRLLLIHNENSELAKRVYNLSCQGKDMAQIEIIISDEYKKIFDITPEADVSTVEDGSKFNSLPENTENNFTKLILCMEKMIINQDMMIQEMQKQNKILMNMILGSGVREKAVVEKKVMARSEIINKIKEFYKQGYGKNKIAKILNESGISTVSGKGKWSPSSVARLKKEIGTQEINHD